MARVQAQKGDIVKVTLPGGHAYLQLVGKIPGKQLSAIRVFAGIHCEDIAKEEILTLKTAYYFASLMDILLESSHFSIVAHETENIPGVPAFRKGFLLVLDADGERPIRGFSDGLEDMPEIIAVPAPDVLDRLATGWTPRKEFRSLEQRSNQQGKELLRNALFWITYPSKEEAEGALEPFRERGFIASLVHYERIDVSQIKAEMHLSGAREESRNRFAQIEGLVREIAGQTNGNKIQSGIE